MVNPSLADDQVDDVVKPLTASLPGTELMKNNRHLLQLLLEGTSVAGNRERTQLESQLSETSQAIGFTVKVADSIKKLKERLASDSSDLVMAMIHMEEGVQVRGKDIIPG